MQCRNAPALQEEGEHRAEEVNLDQVGIGRIRQVADDAVGPEVEVGDPGEAQDVAVVQPVDARVALAVVGAVRAGVGRRDGLPVDVARGAI